MYSPDSQPSQMGDGRVLRFGPADPCPHCNTGTKNCSQEADGLIFCRDEVTPGLAKGRVVNGLVYLGQAGRDPQWALFRRVTGRSGALRRQPARREPKASRAATTPPPPVVTLTDEAAVGRDHVYRRLISLMSLSPPHARNLCERGLTPDQVRARAYRSLPGFKERCNLARTLRDEFGDDVFGVPGVHLFESKSKPGIAYPSVYPGPGGKVTGIVILVVDRLGRVIALRVRVDQVSAENKYRWFRRSTDPKPGTFVHFGWPWSPAAEPDRPVPEVRVTEGELKAGTAAFRTGMLTLSLPGVSAWRKAGPELEYLTTRGLRTVVIALDQDMKVNPQVYGAAMNLFDLCRGLGLAVEVETWGTARGA